MPIPHLHILHPQEQRRPGITSWIAQAQDMLRSDAAWDGCRFRRVEYDDQASFDVPTQSDLVLRNLGPVILIQKVQQRARERFERLVQRRASVYCITPTCPEDLWQAFEDARTAYEDGEPRIPLRELIAYLILRKLEKLDRWGGTATNKAFLWSENLPKGGFPKDLVEPRVVLDVARELERHNVLQTKTSCGQRKFALGAKNIVQPILDSKSFESIPALRSFFERGPVRVRASLLDYNDSTTQ
jgi:hypothetical protein